MRGIATHHRDRVLCCAQRVSTGIIRFDSGEDPSRNGGRGHRHHLHRTSVSGPDYQNSGFREVKP